MSTASIQNRGQSKSNIFKSANTISSNREWHRERKREGKYRKKTKEPQNGKKVGWLLYIYEMMVGMYERECAGTRACVCAWSSFLVSFEPRQIWQIDVIKDIDEPEAHVVLDSIYVRERIVSFQLCGKWWFIIYIDFLRETEYPLTFCRGYEQWPYHEHTHLHTHFESQSKRYEWWGVFKAIPDRKWNEKNLLQQQLIHLSFFVAVDVVRFSSLQSIKRGSSCGKKAIIDWHQTSVQTKGRERKT